MKPLLTNTWVTVSLLVAGDDDNKRSDLVCAMDICNQLVCSRNIQTLVDAVPLDAPDLHPSPVLVLEGLSLLVDLLAVEVLGRLVISNAKLVLIMQFMQRPRPIN